jgi:hypothetical protein
MPEYLMLPGFMINKSGSWDTGRSDERGLEVGLPVTVSKNLCWWVPVRTRRHWDSSHGKVKAGRWRTFFPSCLFKIQHILLLIIPWTLTVRRRKLDVRNNGRLEERKRHVRSKRRNTSGSKKKVPGFAFRPSDKWHENKDGRPLKMGPTRCPETSVRTFNWINQQHAATFQIYYLSFKYSSTCFGHPHAHHQ